VTMKITVFWNVTLYSLVQGKKFQAVCLHVQGQSKVTLEIEGEAFFGTLV
jgi:hypothetical protein